MAATYGDTNAAGSSNASLPGCSGDDDSSFAGSTTPPISLGLSSSPVSRCSSSNFEIGSNITTRAFGASSVSAGIVAAFFLALLGSSKPMYTRTHDTPATDDLQGATTATEQAES